MDGFYKIIASIESTDLVMILKGYDLKMVCKIPLLKFESFIKKIADERVENVRFDLYKTLLPIMSIKGNPMSYDDFVFGSQKDNRSKEEIEAEFKKLKI